MVLGGRYTYMRVLSMQGKIVWDILKRNRVYYADSTLSREQNDYSEDIKRLNGLVPIWCYYWPEINFYTIYDGELLDYLRMEMSLERRNCWDEFVMFELEVPKNEMTIGYTCNASAYAKILPVLRLDMVMAVYELHDANVENPYYKIITPIWVKANCASDIITSTVLDCEKETLRAEECVEDFLIGDSGKCLTCAKQVQYVRDNKHFCSLACLWEHMRKFIRTACKDGFSEEQAIEHYTRMCDCDFNKGIVKAVKKIKGNLAVTSNIQIMKGRKAMKNFIEERNGWVKSELTTGGYRIPCGFYSITCDKTIRNLNGDPHCVTGANIHFKVYGEDVDTSWYYIVDAPRLSDDDYYFLHLCGERDLHFLAKTISDDNTPIGYTKDEVMKLLNNTDEEE